MFITLIAMLGGCTSTTGSDSGIGIATPQPPDGRLLIEELYYTGSPPSAGTDHYFSDQFIEIVNISDEPVMLGGLMIGDLHGLAGVINNGDTPNSYAEEDPDRVYLANLWRIPGAPEDHMLEPGDSLLIAHDGTNHQPFSSVDLTGADFEAYVESGNDEDYPLVDNLESIHFTGGYDWLMTVFGPSVVLLAPEAVDELETIDRGRWSILAAPNDYVIDAVEALKDGDSGDFKRIPDAVDSGFVYVSGTYSGESVQRIRVDGVLQDSNNSSADFSLADTPAPGW